MFVKFECQASLRVHKVPPHKCKAPLLTTVLISNEVKMLPLYMFSYQVKIRTACWILTQLL